MIDVIDWSMAAQVSVAVAAAMQILKIKKPFNRIDGEYLAAMVGILIAIYFCMVTPTVEATWVDWVRCGVSGLVGGVVASGAYNFQKALPFPNVFPTRSEKEHTP
jgi:hypothetical protein